MFSEFPGMLRNKLEVHLGLLAARKTTSNLLSRSGMKTIYDLPPAGQQLICIITNDRDENSRSLVEVTFKLANSDKLEKFTIPCGKLTYSQIDFVARFISKEVRDNGIL